MSTFSTLNRSIFGVALLSLALSFPANADSSGAKMIEVGGGLEAANSAPTVNLLLRVGAGLEWPGSEGHLVVARISSSISLSNAGGAQTVPYLDIQFVGGFVGGDVEANGGGFRILSGGITRNVRLDEKVAVRVDLVGIQYGVSSLLNGESDEQISLFAKIAVDAIGLRTAEHISSLGTFKGFNIAAAAAEVGAKLQTSDSFSVRVTLGARGDISLGGAAGMGFSAYSDMSAYAQVSADVSKLVRFFAQGSMNRRLNSDFGSMTTNRDEAQLMLGAEFLF